MPRFLLAFSVCVLFVSSVFAQTNNEKMSISFQFGPSNHRFYDLSDFLSNLSSKDIKPDQKFLTFATQFNYRLNEDFQASLVYILDVGNFDLTSNTFPNYPQMTYLTNSYAVKLSWYLYNLEYFKMGLSPYVGYTTYNLWQSENTVDMLIKGKSSGMMYGAAIDNEVQVLDNTNFFVSVGAEIKDSDNISSNSLSFSFLSFNTYLKFGISYFF